MVSVLRNRLILLREENIDETLFKQVYSCYQKKYVFLIDRIIIGSSG